MTGQQLTTLIACWGAVISTVLAILKVIEFRQGEARLHVRIARDMKVHPKSLTYGDKTYLIITAANRGQRPVYLGNAGLLYRCTFWQKNGGCVAVDSLRQPEPIKLEEGAARDFLIQQDQVDRDVGRYGYVAYVSDRTGRTFYSHPWWQRLLRVWRTK